MTLNLDEIEQRAAGSTGLKWLTSEDTKRLDALAADVAALVAEVKQAKALLSDVRGYLVFRDRMDYDTLRAEWKPLERRIYEMTGGLPE